MGVILMNETDRSCRRQKVNGGVQGGYVVSRIVAGWDGVSHPPEFPKESSCRTADALIVTV